MATYYFVPVVIKTLGALGEGASTFFYDLGLLIATVASEPRSYEFLLQRLSVAVQRGNAACVLRTFSRQRNWTIIIYLQISFAFHCVIFFHFKCLILLDLYIDELLSFNVVSWQLHVGL